MYCFMSIFRLCKLEGNKKDTTTDSMKMLFWHFDCSKQEIKNAWISAVTQFCKDEEKYQHDIECYKRAEFQGWLDTSKVLKLDQTQTAENDAAEQEAASNEPTTGEDPTMELEPALGNAQAVQDHSLEEDQRTEEESAVENAPAGQSWEEVCRFCEQVYCRGLCVYDGTYLSSDPRFRNMLDHDCDEDIDAALHVRKTLNKHHKVLEKAGRQELLTKFENVATMLMSLRLANQTLQTDATRYFMFQLSLPELVNLKKNLITKQIIPT